MCTATFHQFVFVMLYIFFIFIFLLSPILALNFSSAIALFAYLRQYQATCWLMRMTVGIVIQYLSKWERIVDLDSFIIYITKRDWLYYISCWNWITIRRVIFKESITRGNYIGADWELDRKLSSFDPLESSVTAIEGNPAYKIEFTATDDKQEKTQSNANIDSKRRESIFIYV